MGFICQLVTSSVTSCLNSSQIKFINWRNHRCESKMTLQTERFSIISHSKDFNVNFLYNLSQLETIQNIVEVTAQFSRSVLPQNNNKCLVLFINEVSAPIADRYSFFYVSFYFYWIDCGCKCKHGRWYLCDQFKKK